MDGRMDKRFALLGKEPLGCFGSSLEASKNLVLCCIQNYKK